MVKNCYYALILSTLFIIICTPVIAGQDTSNGINASPHEFAKALNSVEDLGIGVLRTPIDWQEVEPSNGKFDWDETDAIVNRAAAIGVEILFTIRAISSWGTKQQFQPSKNAGYHSGSMPKDLSQWSVFMSNLAKRYSGRKVHYEISNEVNSHAFWIGTLDDYVSLLQVSYKSIKAVNPDAIVLQSAMACGITNNIKPNQYKIFYQEHDKWLNAILATGYFDAVNVHNYYFPSLITANGASFQSYLKHIFLLMQQNGVTHIPIWITETGYVSQPTNVSGRVDEGSPEKQALWLEEAYTISLNNGVKRIFWLLIQDRDEPYFGSMGLADSSGNPRPAWNSLRNFFGNPN